MKNVVKTDQAPGAIGPYSQGIQVGDMYFFSGQIPLVPSTGEMPEGIEAQAHQALKNVKGLLDSQGLSFSNVVKTTVFLDNMDDFTTVNGIYAEYFAFASILSCHNVCTIIVTTANNCNIVIIR